MSAQNGHITSKVILGYLLLILIAVCSVVYISVSYTHLTLPTRDQV